ncbi:helix-turn-helix domain-containing protein [Streptomyces aurantiogriseus]|uniref:MerR family transcriptional regulator n=1 Tax=Streptomyces aurantiogriseus TaxID=66870 RepID=A0A918FMG5_9ACTN|nr:MerR family transcriptional regulator [Streptomyces aurantiogriseus]GGR55674.1 MerR family transcriptional regulator [Streptomyces aurantiogriseus]
MRSSEQSETLGIGALAERFGLAPHVLRHWESVGLLAPERDAAGRRRYGAADVVRVAVVLRGKEAGLSLEAIRTLTAGSPGVRRAVLRREAETLRARIAAAQASLDLVECALGCAQEDLAACPHFRPVLGNRSGSKKRSVPPPA